METSHVGATSMYSISFIYSFDAGKYECFGENEFGTATSLPATLTVQYIGDITLAVKPSTTVHDKTQVTIECTVAALPAAEIQLSRNDGIFFSSSNATLNRELGGTKEYRENHVSYTVVANKDWMGNIQCLGKNLFGKIWKSKEFIVQTRPSSPTQCVNMTTMALAESVTYYFVLGSDGDSPITKVIIECYKGNGKTVVKTGTSTNFEHSNCTAAELAGLTSGTTYTCQLFAENAVGRSDGSDSFEIKTYASVPATPDLDPQPVQVNETTLTVSWTVDYNGGESITRYTVRWTLASSTSDSDWLLHPLVLPHTGLSQENGEHTLDGLKRNAQYSVEVIATNKEGESEPGRNVYTTLCFPGQITEVEKVELNREVDNPSTTVKLSVTIPDDKGCGEITNYIVTDATTGEELTSVIVARRDGKVTLEMSGLEADKEYQLQVSVSNSNGDNSPASAAVTIKTEPFEESTNAPDDSLSTGIIAEELCGQLN
ncbi:neural cell adhesion molecule 1-like isoform X2 [Corticium candelabrum]|uniref:neural cell adhesion molecule 1-like isoform X2 n=1 Tax=Corticium candelabrum TaxID=121492 RepID=UPI002E261C53|nr:neural cell adhesion molecule 1-like isoform X2 [Corticium candelabrum]